MINVSKQALKGVKAIDLFAGIGGFHQALSSFGADVVYASEWDKNAAAVYADNYGIIPAGDITRINERDVPNHNIACLGFPCQAFSISGSRKGFEDSRGTLFFDAARIAKEKQPEVLFIENVKNLVSHDNGNTFKVIIKTLDEIGYDAYHAILNAADYGVPQSRKRIYIVAFRKDLEVTKFKFPEPIELKRHLEDLLEPDSLRTDNLCIHRDDISYDLTAGKTDSKPVRIGTVNKGGQGERIYDPRGTAITLSAYGGGVGAKTGLYLVNNKVRRLTPRECARLQGFPESFKLHDNRNVCYQQFGNSVVIDVLQQIIQEIIEIPEVMKEWQE